MRRLLPLLLLVPLAQLLLAGAGCRPTRLEGVPIGQYEVRGTLASNACAEGYPAPTELWFHVELRDEPGSSLGYWKLSDGPIASGMVDREGGTFRFEDRQEVLGIEAQPGYVGCVLSRQEVVAGAFVARAADDGGSPDAAAGAEGGSPDAAAGTDGGTPGGGAARRDAGAQLDVGEGRFEGTTTVTVSTASGDCSPLLDPSQGGFPVLPCSIVYDIGGERLETNLW